MHRLRPQRSGGPGGAGSRSAGSAAGEDRRVRDRPGCTGPPARRARPQPHRRRQRPRRRPAGGGRAFHRHANGREGGCGQGIRHGHAWVKRTFESPEPAISRRSVRPYGAPLQEFPAGAGEPRSRPTETREDGRSRAEAPSCTGGHSSSAWLRVGWRRAPGGHWSPKKAFRSRALCGTPMMSMAWSRTM